MRATPSSSGIRSTSCLAVVAVALALGGCGSDDEAATTATTTVTAQATGPTGATGSASASAAAGTSRSDAIALVERYYHQIEEEQFSEAWLLVPAAVRAESGGFENWKAGYGANVRSDPTNIRVASFSANSATVSLDLNSTDIDACTGAHVDQAFSGSWTLRAEGGEWKPDAISMEKVSGATPALECGGEPSQPPPQPPENCTPGYSPCLPPASDYDCEGGTGDGPEYTGTVQVSGSDPYGLDADHNGVGC